MKKRYTKLENFTASLFVSSLMAIAISSIFIIFKTGSIKLMGVIFGLSIANNIIFFIIFFIIFNRIMTIEKFKKFKHEYGFISVRLVAFELIVFLLTLFWFPIYYI